MDHNIFIVQYDYDLNGDFIQIPDNSIILFLGGSFNNGTIVLGTDDLFLPFGFYYCPHPNMPTWGSPTVIYSGSTNYTPSVETRYSTCTNSSIQCKSAPSSKPTFAR